MVFHVAMIMCAPLSRRDLLDILVSAIVTKAKEEGHEFVATTYIPWEDFNIDDILSKDGIIISGSPHNIVDNLPWFPSLYTLIQRAVADDSGPSVFGSCFGCQALAAALGGVVSPNLTGRFTLARDNIFWNDICSSLSGEQWFEPIGNSTVSHITSSHGYCVSTPPAGATVLAHSESSSCEVFVYRQKALGVQSHPEFSDTIVTDILLPVLDAKVDRTAVLASLETADDHSSLLAAIVRFMVANGRRSS